MRGFGIFTTVGVVLALGFANTTLALWSPEPVDLPESQPLPANEGTPSAVPKPPLGFTPPLDLRDLQTDGTQDDDPVARHLAAGQAEEVIEIPFLSARDAAGKETFTRVNPVATTKKPKPATPGRVSDTPIPSPTGLWLMLGAMPILLLLHRRHRTRFG